MKLSRSWIEDYVDLGGLSDDDVAERLTEIGHTVEGVEHAGDDTVFDVEFTTNRVDAMSHLGIARELAAAFDREMRNLPREEPGREQGENVTIRIEVPEMCGRFSGLLIRGVRVGPSSELVQRRLEAVGLRPISNLVDATNYVMMALGHPLHAYDFDRLRESTIVVRDAKKGEVLRSLDGIDRRLEPGDVVIADGGRGVGLGGVIGGANTEIDDTTTNVLLECAHFAPSVIRRTARRLGISTDASYRFERGVDPSDTVRAVVAAADLILEMAGGERIELIDVVARPAERASVTLRNERLDLFGAGSVEPGFAKSVLARLGMEPRDVDGGIEISVPTWRGDVEQEIDLIEEVLRFHGYNNVPAALPRVTSGDDRHDPVLLAEERVRNVLVAAGLSETINYGFVHESENAMVSDETPLAITNALTENIASMRVSLLPGLLQTVQHNLSYGNRDGAIFEVGHTYHRSASGADEFSRAGIALFGSVPSHWGDPHRAVDFFDVKGIVEAVAKTFHVDLEFDRAELKWAREGAGASARVGDRVVARSGVVARGILQKAGIKGDVIAAEIDIEPLLGASGDWTMTEVSRFPGVPMVLRLMHAPDLEYGTMAAKIRELDVPYLRRVGIWDRFVPAKDAEEVKTTLGMWYQANDRSLTQDEVAAIHDELAGNVKRLLPVKIVES